MKLKKSKNGQESIRINTVKRTFYLLLIAMLFSTAIVTAQSTPEPPEPPTTPKTTSNSSHTVSIKKSEGAKHNSSVSISVSDDEYKFRARFHQSKNNGVKAILMEQLGKNNLNINGSTFIWTNNKGNDIFECKLTNGRLRIYLDTEEASNKFIEDIKTLGNTLKQYISGSKDNDE